MVRKAVQKATKEDVAALLEQFSAPSNRRHVDWPVMRAKLIEAAKGFGLTLPPYLAEGGDRG